MIWGTTPDFTFQIKNQNVDLSEANNVYVSFTQNETEIIKSGNDLEIDGRTVSVWLTQEESMRLKNGKFFEVQINWTYLALDGVTVRRAATKPKAIPVEKQLLKRVIE